MKQFKLHCIDRDNVFAFTLGKYRKWSQKNNKHSILHFLPSHISFFILQFHPLLSLKMSCRRMLRSFHQIYDPKRIVKNEESTRNIKKTKERRRPAAITILATFVHLHATFAHLHGATCGTFSELPIFESFLGYCTGFACGEWFICCCHLLKFTCRWY